MMSAVELFARWGQAALLLLCLLSRAEDLSAQGMREKALLLNGWIEDDGSSVHLTWNGARRTHRGTVHVARRSYGAVGGESWAPIEVEKQNGLHVVDRTTQFGQVYEYRVLRRNMNGQTNDVGYWIAGHDLSGQSNRGMAHLVVDQTVVASLGDYLDRFVQDLSGDGWQVRSYAMPRHDSRDPHANLLAIRALRTRLQSAYVAAPDTRHAVILVGHVPFAYSGQAAPDGHASKPHPTDLIYGDIDGRWRLLAEGRFADNALPSDAIEMQVGRIDFRPLSVADTDREVQLLRAYFDKNHNWRHARLGDLRQAYGTGPGLVGELHGLHNIVGPQAVTKGGHHDVGETRPWLWGVDFGDAAGHIYAQRYANKAIFAINFGSHKQRIDQPDNAMTALLAQPWYPLAVGWGARPTWRLHHMALGGSIGDVHQRTVNNGRAADPYATSMDYLPTGRFLWRNPVWVNLLGDPTLRAFPLAPPGAVFARTQPGGTQLTWDRSPDLDILGYAVFKQRSDGTFAHLSGSQRLLDLQFVDETFDAEDAVYMVRALGRKAVHAGSFLTLSQGAFTRVGDPPLKAPDLAVTISAEQEHVIKGPHKDGIFGFVTGPDRGALRFEEAAWRYTAPVDFTGTVTLPYMVSRGLQHAQGILTLRVQD